MQHTISMQIWYLEASVMPRFMQGRRKATIEITLDAGVAVRRSPLLLSLGRTLSAFDRASILA